MNLCKTSDQLNKKNAISQKQHFITELSAYIYSKNLVSLKTALLNYT